MQRLPRDVRPACHGWVFDVRSGRLVDLGLDMEAEVASIREIHDLKPLG